MYRNDKRTHIQPITLTDENVTDRINVTAYIEVGIKFNLEKTRVGAHRRRNKRGTSVYLFAVGKDDRCNERCNKYRSPLLCHEILPDTLGYVNYGLYLLMNWMKERGLICDYKLVPRRDKEVNMKHVITLPRCNTFAQIKSIALECYNYQFDAKYETVDGGMLNSLVESPILHIPHMEHH